MMMSPPQAGIRFLCAGLAGATGARVLSGRAFYLSCFFYYHTKISKTKVRKNAYVNPAG